MTRQRRLLYIPLVLLASCLANGTLGADKLGAFKKGSDLFLAQFDSKTDVDDIHSIAAVATMLADPRFADVTYHAVAGAYGIQSGLYVPSNELFEMAFGTHWSDRHADPEKALGVVTQVALEVIQSGGSVWIAEGGQSNFSAALLRNLQNQMPDHDLKSRIHIVQHGGWNERTTTPEDLAFVKKEVTYYKIPDGNLADNGTPNFRHDDVIHWQKHITDPRLVAIWELALDIANRHNGVEGRYLNATIMKGGLDFSDAIESTWIFGFNDMADANDFFEEFSTEKAKGSE